MQAQYYGHTITIAAPPLASACLSVFVVAMQPNELRYTPGYMEQYVTGRTFSERMDDEWHRLIMCSSMTAPQKALAGCRFTPSVLIGSWKGTVLVRLSILRLQFSTIVLTSGHPNQTARRSPTLKRSRTFCIPINPKIRSASL